MLSTQYPYRSRRLRSTKSQRTHLARLGHRAVLSDLARSEFRPQEGDLARLHASRGRFDFKDIGSRGSRLQQATTTKKSTEPTGRASAFEMMYVRMPCHFLRATVLLTSRDDTVPTIEQP